MAPRLVRARLRALPRRAWPGRSARALAGCAERAAPGLDAFREHRRGQHLVARARRRGAVRSMGHRRPASTPHDLRGGVCGWRAPDRHLGCLARRRSPAQRRRLHLMRRKLRLALAALVVVLGALAIVAVLERSWTAAQLRAVVVLSTTEQTPVLAWTVRVLTHEPRVEETTVGGAPSTVVRPGKGDGPWPAIVFVNGATRVGRRHEKVQRLAEGLARAGFLVVVPDLPGLPLGEITPATKAATIRAARATADRPDVLGGEAPWADLERVVRLATTGFYDGGRYEVDPYVELAVARSLAAGGHPRLLERLEAIDDEDPQPLATLHGTQPLVRLLVNRNPARFDDLYGRLPARMRRSVELLSPIRRADRLRMPVELATAPHDKYFPP